MHLKTSDGRGGTYDDTWVHSTSADQVKLAIYGAERSSDGALTLMIVNKRGENLTHNPNLSGFNPRGSAQVYRYSAVNLGPVACEANQAAGGNASRQSIQPTRPPWQSFPKWVASKQASRDQQPSFVVKRAVPDVTQTVRLVLCSYQRPINKR
jgi:hypothetical protein